MIEDVLQVLRSRNRFLITTHVRPDGDAIGSQLALGMFLRRLGKQVAMINTDPTPGNLDWLPGVDAIEAFNGRVAHHDAFASADVIVVVDTNTLGRLGRTVGDPVRNSRALTVLIDHHTEPETWFDHTFVRERAAATGELIHELIQAHDAYLIEEEIATALYVAILTDTGSFRFGTVTPAVHRIAADLLERGSMPPAEVYAAIYESRGPHWVRLLSRVLSTITIRYDGLLSYVVVKRRMIRETAARYDDTEGFVDYAMAVDGVKVALVFIETLSGTKVSFRSRGERSVDAWARSFGGGGHRNASGAYFKRPLEEVIDLVVASAPRYIGHAHAEHDSALSSEDEAYLSALMEIQ